MDPVALSKIGTRLLTSLGRKGKNRNSVACLRIAGSYFAGRYCTRQSRCLNSLLKPRIACSRRETEEKIEAQDGRCAAEAHNATAERATDEGAMISANDMSQSQARRPTRRTSLAQKKRPCRVRHPRQKKKIFANLFKHFRNGLRHTWITSANSRRSPFPK